MSFPSAFTQPYFSLVCLSVVIFVGYLFGLNIGDLFSVLVVSFFTGIIPVSSVLFSVCLLCLVFPNHTELIVSFFYFFTLSLDPLHLLQTWVTLTTRLSWGLTSPRWCC